MANNWLKPDGVLDYDSVWDEVQARVDALAVMDFTLFTDTNYPPVGTIRWNAGNAMFEKHTSTPGTWEALLSTQWDLDAKTVGGNLPSAFAPVGHVGSVGTGVHGEASITNPGFMSTSDKTKLDDATSANSANKLLIRDANGRANVEAPISGDNIATYGWINPTRLEVINATSADTGFAIMKRDSAGRARVKDPSDDLDIVNLQTLNAKGARSHLHFGHNAALTADSGGDASEIAQTVDGADNTLGYRMFRAGNVTGVSVQFSASAVGPPANSDLKVTMLLNGADKTMVLTVNLDSGAGVDKGGFTLTNPFGFVANNKIGVKIELISDAGGIDEISAYDIAVLVEIES